jgi:putative inorganic carbon (hco3(-)) transporter
MSTATLRRFGSWFDLPEDFMGFAAVTVAVLCILSALYAPQILALCIAALLAIIFFENPFGLLMVMAFLIPFNFIVVVGQVPLAAELLKVAVWGPFLLFLITRRKRFVASRYNLFFLVIAALLAYSCLTATDFAFTFKESLRLLSSIGLVYLAVNLVDTKEKLFIILKTIGISSLIVAVYGLYQYSIHDYGALFWIVNPRISTDLAPSRADFWEWRNRLMSFLTSEMEAGDYIAYCIPLAAALAVTAKRFGERMLWRTTVIFLLIALLLTFTFGSWIGFGAALIYFVWVFRKRLRLKIIAAALVVFAASAITFALTNQAYLSDKVEQIAWDYATRLAFWLVAWKEFLDHPIHGGGLGSFGPLVAEQHFSWLGAIWADTTSPHNIYLYILSQFGIVGFLAVFGVFVYALLLMVRVGRAKFGQADIDLRWIAFALGFSIIVLLVSGSADDSTLFGPHTSYLIWLLIGLTDVVARFARKNQDEEITLAA